MTSHELAKLLLGGEDLPIVVWRDDGTDQSLEIKDKPVLMLRSVGEDDTCSEEEYKTWAADWQVEKVLEIQV
jgi:hypothetical protein